MWTSETPTRPGFYWYKDPRDQGVVYIVEIDKNMEVWQIDREGDTPLHKFAGEWLGPITPAQYIEWAQGKRA